MEKEEIVTIHINVISYEDIFNTMDYGILPKRKLNDQLEDYILNEVVWYSLKTPMEMVFYLDKGVEKGMEYAIESAVREHFYERMLDVERRNRLDMQNWYRNAMIGLLFFGVNLLLIQYVTKNSEYDFLAEIFSIIGSVSLWEPIGYILYGWQEGKQRKCYNKKISKLPIGFQFKTEEDKKVEQFLGEERR